MACHALTNWATKSFGNSVAKFECLRLSCQGSGQSGYQAGTFDGEDVTSAKLKVHMLRFLNMLQTWQSDLITLSSIFCWFVDYPIFTSQVERVINEWMNEWKVTKICLMFQCFRVSFPALRTYWRLTPQPESVIFEVRIYSKVES